MSIFHRDTRTNVGRAMESRRQVGPETQKQEIVKCERDLDYTSRQRNGICASFLSRSLNVFRNEVGA